ncbi:hypothetical protein LTS18_007897 [Coniosporium uncinatum]|uniref:Uncharacterized protein n=1 Tax=Coniosporium uncinatum TaxID=93489 RepID=A0ACC3DNQ2_9PEZI|nr:hypothetical protein LTS18_007897 [Coniosporium uncinatum]
MEKRVDASNAGGTDDVGKPSKAAAGTFTANDQEEMRRKGKKPELMLNFRIISSATFTSLVVGTWELLLATNTPALISGGLSGLFWSYVWIHVGRTFIMLSLAEMLNMAPTGLPPLKPSPVACGVCTNLNTAGGQYHWISEFCASKIPKSLISLNNPSYKPARWEATLLTITFAIGMGRFNILAARWLAYLEGSFAVLHFLALIPFIVVLWAKTPTKQPASDFYLNFADHCAKNQVAAMYAVLGSDAAAHMAEEIRGADVVVPRTMWRSFVANMPLALAVLLSYFFTTGFMGAVLAALYGFPSISVFAATAGYDGTLRPPARQAPRA